MRAPVFFYMLRQQAIELSEPPAQWNDLAAIAQYAECCLRELGLSHWTFAWDRAVRRLGCCHISKKRITLSRPFVQHYLTQEASKQGIITDTLLHELAHALAWERHRQRGHGATWRHYCAALGIPDARSCTPCEPFELPQSRYALVLQSTGEILYYYCRKPRLSAAKLKTCYMPGRKAETMGKLQLIKLDEPSAL